jgi:hypothetical protein
MRYVTAMNKSQCLTSKLIGSYQIAHLPLRLTLTFCETETKVLSVITDQAGIQSSILTPKKGANTEDH